MKKTLFVIFLFTACLILHCFAAVRFPAYSGFVNDYAGILDSDTQHRLESLCNQLEDKTSAELAIAIIKTSAPLDPKEYAVKLFENWKIGKADKDNGVLILLAMNEKRIEVEVGYGIEGVINDALAGEVLDKYVIPYFKQERYSQGLYNGAVAIADIIARASSQELGVTPSVLQAGSTESGIIRLVRKQTTGSVIVIVIFILLILLSIFAAGIASGIFGALFGGIMGFAFGGVIGSVIGAIIGFVLSYTKFPTSGGFGGSSFGGGFGGGGGGFGFGGGGSGGGGAGRSW